MNKNITYIIYLFLTILSLTLVFLIPSYLLHERRIGRFDLVEQAFTWQKISKGIVNPPVFDGHKFFREITLRDRINDINTIIFGSSTVMSITNDMFPSSVHLYNFSMNSQTTGNSIKEALYFSKLDVIKFILIGLDWNLGMIYKSENLDNYDLENSIMLTALNKPSLSNKIIDALSLPQIKALLSVVIKISKNSNKKMLIKKYFFGDYIGDPYFCEGLPARDFHSAYEKECVGFRYDGSSTFKSLLPLNNMTGNQLTLTMIQPDSHYYKYFYSHLKNAKGIPIQKNLDNLLLIQKNLKAKHGSLFLILPPLMPGYVKVLIASNPNVESYYQRTMDILEEWSIKNNLTIIDASRSEDYGCEYKEFVDAYHALKECYYKIFIKFWSQYSVNKNFAGIFHPDQIRNISRSESK